MILDRWLARGLFYALIWSGVLCTGACLYLLTRLLMESMP